jgi:trk system potassium uptake protein TrkA
MFSVLRDGYFKLNIPKEDVRNTVYNDEEFSAYADRIDAAFDAWKDQVDEGLRSIDEDVVVNDYIKELSELLPRVSIIQGDCGDSEVLDEEGISEVDACIALTDDEKQNTIVALYARASGVERVISRVDSDSMGKMLPGLGLDCTISPRQLCAASVLRYLRGLENSKKMESKLRHPGAKGREVTATTPEKTERAFGIQALYKLCDGRAEAIEFVVDENFRSLGVPFMSPDFRLKKNTLIALIVRSNEVIHPNGHTTLEVGDSVIVVTTSEQTAQLNDILM